MIVNYMMQVISWMGKFIRLWDMCVHSSFSIQASKLPNPIDGLLIVWELLEDAPDDRQSIVIQALQLRPQVGRVEMRPGLQL